MQAHDIAVQEGYISEEEWDEFIAQRDDGLSSVVFQDDRGTRSPVPDSPSSYMTKLQLSCIIKRELAGWELVFIRRAKPTEALIVMRLPGSKQRVAIEKDGEIKTLNDAAVRSFD